MIKKYVLIATSPLGVETAKRIQRAFPEIQIYSSSSDVEGVIQITSVSSIVAELFDRVDALIFVGAMGICVRAIAPHIKDKKTDPAVVNIDATGDHVISVLSGHLGGANELSRKLAGVLGTAAIVTTQSDQTDLWALDLLDKEHGWKREVSGCSMNEAIALFVNKRTTALLIDNRVRGVGKLLSTLPKHVVLVHSVEEIKTKGFSLAIIVSHRIYDLEIPTVFYRPQVLHIGIGCRRQCQPQGIAQEIERRMISLGYSPKSLATISTIELKKDEPLLAELKEYFSLDAPTIYQAEELELIETPNPSEKVRTVTGVGGVSESSAILSADMGRLVIEKQKGCLSKGNDFTFAVAQERGTDMHEGHIEIVGAGPGDPELVSVRGKRFLEQADLILYAGSLVPVELTYYAKEGAIIKSSADMNLEEQIDLMAKHYRNGDLIVRLHTGDPCIYGAIQEQMALLDELGMNYHITPGISSFQAAAAALKSEFTIPEKVQTIILTRGEGRTPMPEKEKLHLLARSQSTMCIFLSALLAQKVQDELLEHYPPTTPVAVCYKLTWKEERIWRGELQHLALIVKENNLKLTTMIVVGESIGNRKGVSKLYADEFKHLFRR